MAKQQTAKGKQAVQAQLQKPSNGRVQPDTYGRNWGGPEGRDPTTNQGQEYTRQCDNNQPGERIQECSGSTVLEAQPIWAGLLAYSLQCFSNFAHPNCNIWDIQFNISIFNTSQILGIPIGYWNVSAYRPDPHGLQLKISV